MNMKKSLSSIIFFFILSMLTSCLDHDDPKLSPIDTSEVTVSASVSELPNSGWLTQSEELTIKVSDIRISAPKGVVLKSVSLVANSGMSMFVVDDKPFSGQPLEFKVPLGGMRGRINFSLRGSLIKKDSRDAEILIADNIQRIIFTEKPEFECEGSLNVSVKSRSTSGEEYSNYFEVKSIDHFTIPIPTAELYWTPKEGSAPTIEVELQADAIVWSPNTSFKGKVSGLSIGHDSGQPSTLKLTMPNAPGSLSAKKLQLYVDASFFGTWENVTIDPVSHLYVFGITETVEK